MNTAAVHPKPIARVKFIGEQKWITASGQKCSVPFYNVVSAEGLPVDGTFTRNDLIRQGYEVEVVQ